MKQIIKYISFLVAFLLSTNIYAQTPFDQYTKPTKIKPMLELEATPKFKAYNLDTNSKVSFLEFDEENSTLLAYSKDGSLVAKSFINPQTVKWLSTDPLAKKTPYSSPYCNVDNNPILFKDPDGRFKINYNEADLKQNGLTKMEVVRFEQIVKNMGNIVKDNPTAMSAIANTTDYSNTKIISDLAFNSGPNINLSSSGSFGGKDNINIDYRMIKGLASINDPNELAVQTFAMYLTILHEYGHEGDQTNNSGANTGQYMVITTDYGNGSNTHRLYDKNTGSKDKGCQNWQTSRTGHRGTDIEIMGFGTAFNENVTTGKFEQKPYSITKPYSGLNSTTAPSFQSQVPDAPSSTQMKEVQTKLGVK